MTLHTIRKISDPILNQRAKEIQNMTPHLKTLIADMVETIRAANGMGLAASQVGVLKWFVIIECEEGRLHVSISPRITERGDEQTGYEGCLSVPGEMGIVTWPMHIIVRALNEEMQPVTAEGEKLLARALCHEVDHLNGRLYTEVVEELYTNKEFKVMQEEEAAEEQE